MKLSIFSCTGLRVEELLRELNEANRNAINKEQKKNDTEWSLGEHRQWLADAKNKLEFLKFPLLFDVASILLCQIF